MVHRLQCLKKLWLILGILFVLNDLCTLCKHIAKKNKGETLKGWTLLCQMMIHVGRFVQHPELIQYLIYHTTAHCNNSRFQQTPLISNITPLYSKHINYFHHNPMQQHQQQPLHSSPPTIMANNNMRNGQAFHTDDALMLMQRAAASEKVRLMIAATKLGRSFHALLSLDRVWL